MKLTALNMGETKVVASGEFEILLDKIHAIVSKSKKDGKAINASAALVLSKLGHKMVKLVQGTVSTREGPKEHVWILYGSLNLDFGLGKDYVFGQNKKYSPIKSIFTRNMLVDKKLANAIYEKISDKSATLSPFFNMIDYTQTQNKEY